MCNFWTLCSHVCEPNLSWKVVENEFCGSWKTLEFGLCKSWKAVFYCLYEPCGNVSAIWDHTARQRRHSFLYPSKLKLVLGLATPEGCKAELT